MALVRLKLMGSSLDQKSLAIGDSLFLPTHGVFLERRRSDLSIRPVVVRVGEQRERRSKKPHDARGQRSAPTDGFLGLPIAHRVARFAG